MNLQVDLIYQSERRSASTLNLKAALRVLTIVVPAAAVLLIVLLIVNFLQRKYEVALLEAKWDATSPRKREADVLRNQVSRNRAILAQLQGLEKSRLDWRRQLAGLLVEVPGGIQLRNLTAGQFLHLEQERVPARTFSMTVTGKATGISADADVERLRRRLLDSPIYAPEMETVEVASYGVDSTRGADRDDRAFRIDCTYSTRQFE